VDGTADNTKVVVGQSQHICTKSHNFVNIPAEYEATVIEDGNTIQKIYDVVKVKDSAFAANNKIYTVKATVEGLKLLRNAEQVAQMRGKTVEEILG
jgi:ribosomal protein S5